MSVHIKDLLLHHLILGKWRKGAYFLITVRTIGSGLEDNLGLIIVIGQISQKTVSKTLIFICKSLLENALGTKLGEVRDPELGKGSKLNQDPVITESSDHCTWSFRVGRALDSYSY